MTIVLAALLPPLGARSLRLGLMVCAFLVTKCWRASVDWNNERSCGEFSLAMRKVLSDTDPSKGVIWVGAPFCYNVELDWPGRSEYRWVPISHDLNEQPRLCRKDDQLIAEARAGFDIGGLASRPDPNEKPWQMNRWWFVQPGPEMLRTGSQRVLGASLEGKRDADGRIRRLLFKPDRKIDDYVIVSGIGGTPNKVEAPPCVP
jgi:hypothetical protein